MADHDDVPYIVIERSSGGIGAFLWGALVGAAAALLLAPRTGEETRDELRTGVRRIRDRAERTVRDLQSTVSDTIDGVRTEVSTRVEAARDAFEAGREAARESRSDMERRVHETRARVRAGFEAARRPPTADAAGGSAAQGAAEGESDTDLGI